MLARALLVVLAALVIALAACGGDDDGGGEVASVTGTESAATIAPANASGYVALNTDLDSEQWKQAKALAERFPGRQMLLDMIESELSSEGVDLNRDVVPAVGPEVVLVFLQGQDEPVALTQPEDQAKLDALLAKGDEPTVKEDIEGWTAIAETKAQLDAFKSARSAGTLDDDEEFKAAVGELPEDALVKAYADGAALTQTAGRMSGMAGGPQALLGGGTLVWVGAALEAVDDGFKLGGIAKAEGAEGGEAYEPKLLDRVPGDSLLVLSFANAGASLDMLRENPELGQGLAQVEQQLGVSAAELAALFSGESAIYMRSGSPIPEVTLLLDVENEANALRTLDKLASRASAVGGRTGKADVDGVATSYVEIQGVRVSYAAFDGLIAVTSGVTGIRDARSDGDKIEGNESFEAAADAVELGDETSGLFFANLDQLVPLIQGFAGLAGEQLPTEVSANLAPLRGFIANASKDGDELRFTAFLGVE